MKKHTFLFLLVFPAICFGQKYPTGKGTLRTGGGVGFTRTNLETGYEYRFSMNPKIGYFIFNEVQIGLDIAYIGISNPVNYTSQIDFGPNARYYFRLGKSTFLLADGGYDLSRKTIFNPANKITDDNSSFFFGPGIDYFFTRRLGVEALILYTYYLYPDETHIGQLAFSFGFNIHLPFKKEINANKNKMRE